MFAVTAILSCVIKIRGLFKSTNWRHFENVKFEALSARRGITNDFVPDQFFPWITCNNIETILNEPVLLMTLCQISSFLGTHVTI